MSYSNQKIIKIVKSKYERDFLQIGITEWQNAYRLLTPSAFAIYLYLASNADGFYLELSQKAIENSLGIKKTAYFEAVKQLEDKGYIQPISGNMFYFLAANSGKTENSAKTNLATEQLVRKNGQESPEKRIENSAKTDESVRFYDREIDNIDNIKDKIEEGAAAKAEKPKNLNDNDNVNDNDNDKIEERAATPPASAEIQKEEIEETKIQEGPRRTINYWDRSELGVIGNIDNEKDLVAYLEILFGGQLTSRVKSQLQLYLKTITVNQIARFFFYCDQKEHRNFLKGSEMTLGLLQFEDIRDRANAYWSNLDYRKKELKKEFNSQKIVQEEITVKAPQKHSKRKAYTIQEIEAMI